MNSNFVVLLISIAIIAVAIVAAALKVISIFGTGKSLSEALLFAEHGENMLCTKCVLNVRKISVHNMFSPGLSLEFSCIELVI